MSDDLEQEARRLNAVDKNIRDAINVYIGVGWSREDFLEHVEDMYDEIAADE